MNGIQKNYRKNRSNIFSKLAIHGGQKIRNTLFPAHKTIGTQEEKAVLSVLRSGLLSQFIGTWHENFYGGKQIKEFERKWAEYFNVKHAITVNSATSALYAAVGAIGIEPGDEVIVSPYTMTASSVAPLVYDALPVFADIEPDYFCLDPSSVEKNITNKTRAIIVVDIFGLPYDAQRINAIAKKHNVVVIEDCAQAPGAKYKKKFAGTLADIGIYSLNYHKHIHTGEGGVLVTDNDELAEKLRMIRNHAEAVVDGRNFPTLKNMLGFNYRMTEIEAAIGSEQLKKLDGFLEQIHENIFYLEEKLSKIPCLKMPKVRENSTHSYYVHPIKFDQKIAGIHRNKFVEAVKAELMPFELREKEGVIIGNGYVKPLYLQSIYQNKFVYGKQGHPWNLFENGRNISYEKGICPIAEKMHEDELIINGCITPGMTEKDLDDVARAFEKVWDNKGELI